MMNLLYLIRRLGIGVRARRQRKPDLERYRVERRPVMLDGRPARPPRWRWRWL